jgi:hypothetical protein
MAAPTNTLTSAIQIGAREDLEDVISLVSPEKTPLTSNIKGKKATNVYHEWLTEELAAPTLTNAQLEGDDVTTPDAPNLVTRVGNTCQIFRKTGSVAGTQEAVNLAGRDSEFMHQKVMKGLELKRDMELTICSNQASVPSEAGGTARHMGGVLAWLQTNTSRGQGGANGGFSGGTVNAAVNGTLRPWTETLLKGVVASAYQQGGEPDQLYMGALLKQEASGFTGISQNRHEPGTKVGQRIIVGAMDLYQNDFGTLAMIAHPYAFNRDAFLCDADKIAIGTLRNTTSFDLAKTGDSQKFEIIAEKTLVVSNEKALGVISDIQ